MEAPRMFHPGYGSGIHRPPPPPIFQRPALLPQRTTDDDDVASHRIAHTLTACCRCRQRKTRCDPTLPRCLPCERSGSICEYFDTTKGKKINRYYVVKLQDKVRQLEKELSQYTDDDDFPKSSEDFIGSGGLVRLNESDETPRYLGPSSGIAMTRLLMEQAKRFTDSKRISELIPEVRARRLDRLNRMQSISMGGSISGPAGRRKSYPMLSAHPAPNLPTRAMTEKLVDVFNGRAQVFYPALHEKTFARDLDEVFAGSNDHHKNFIVRMVLAISLQKLDTQYAGLADSYYLAAMQHFEEVVRTKDLRTLQCLILIGQYSLLTPIRTNVYHVIGIAVRICQQLGYCDEKTLTRDAPEVDALTLDMRRRASWIIATMEYGLAHSMGRPNGFAKGEDLMDVGYFADVADQNITEQGIQPGPPADDKLVAIHMCKMRMCQAEIRRTLYEKKKPEPKDHNDPWFVEMDRKLKEWVDSAPEQPAWCKPWFTGRYHSIVIFMYRPSPQVPRSTPSAALTCYDSSAFIIKIGSAQVKKGAIDITWVFLLTVYMAINTVLWCVSYREVREAHPREELEALINTALESLDQCAERWPGAAAASQLYGVFAKACMHSYDAVDEPITLSAFTTTSPSLVDSSSPSLSESSMPSSSMSGNSVPSQVPMFNIPQFGGIFSPQEPAAPTFGFDNPFQQQRPRFREGSIFLGPGTGDTGRRMSNFAPDALHGEKSPGELTPTMPISPPSGQVSPPATNPLPTPPETMITPNSNMISPSSTSFVSASSPTPTLTNTSPHLHQGAQHFKFETPHTPQSQATPQQANSQPIPPQRTPTFTIPPLPQHQAGQHNHQRGYGHTVTNWFNPPPPFISPSTAFNGMNGGSAPGANNFFLDPSSTFSGLGLGGGGMGLNGLGVMGGQGAGGFGGGPGGAAAGMGQFPFGNPERQGSLSQDQQMELMSVLESEGMGEIDSFLNMGLGLGNMDGNVNWQ